MGDARRGYPPGFCKVFTSGRLLSCIVQSIPFRWVTGKVFHRWELAATKCRHDAFGRVGFCFLAPVSIVASRWGVLCQVLERFIASVYRGFGGFWGRGGGLTGSCADGGRFRVAETVCLARVFRGRHRGRRFSRFGCACTPAFGSLRPSEDRALTCSLSPDEECRVAGQHRL